ncbi:hypothetical protein [Streptomyces sp. NPDC047123]|uniref:hypothetical protein n=1 Tax=Streptomyces sp. NPDC047123 TaxID=3155622 RepID=UPI0033DED7AB
MDHSRGIRIRTVLATLGVAGALAAAPAAAHAPCTGPATTRGYEVSKPAND